MLVAVSLDGKISPKRRPGQPNPVGPEYISEEVMALHNSRRAGVDGIMVGLNCILMDDSRLTLREGRGRNPTRIGLDGRLLGYRHRLGEGQQTVIADGYPHAESPRGEHQDNHSDKGDLNQSFHNAILSAVNVSTAIRIAHWRPGCL